MDDRRRYCRGRAAPKVRAAGGGAPAARRPGDPSSVRIWTDADIICRARHPAPPKLSWTSPPFPGQTFPRKTRAGSAHPPGTLPQTGTPTTTFERLRFGRRRRIAGLLYLSRDPRIRKNLNWKFFNDFRRSNTKMRGGPQTITSSDINLSSFFDSERIYE